MDLILKAEVLGVELRELQVQYGTLQCQVPLPTPINVEKVRAELVDGILTITMPKFELCK
jgi:HSP20 family protein